MELVRNFTKLSKSDVAIAGGKGASLGEMTQTGVPVPPGFVILSESFEKFFLMLSRDNVAQVNLLGGEPSLHPKSLDFGRRISEIGVPVGYSTNGLWQEDFRRQLEKVQYPIEFEVTFLGSKGYSPEKLVQIMRSFEQLRNHHTSIGLILTSPNESYKEHLELAPMKGKPSDSEFREIQEKIKRLL